MMRFLHLLRLCVLVFPMCGVLAAPIDNFFWNETLTSLTLANETNLDATPLINLDHSNYTAYRPRELTFRIRRIMPINLSIAKRDLPGLFNVAATRLSEFRPSDLVFEKGESLRRRQVFFQYNPNPRHPVTYGLTAWEMSETLYDLARRWKETPAASYLVAVYDKRWNLRWTDCLAEVTYGTIPSRISPDDDMGEAQPS